MEQWADFLSSALSLLQLLLFSGTTREFGRVDNGFHTRQSLKRKRNTCFCFSQKHKSIAVLFPSHTDTFFILKLPCGVTNGSIVKITCSHVSNMIFEDAKTGKDVKTDWNSFSPCAEVMSRKESAWIREAQNSHHIWFKASFPSIVGEL